MDQSVIAGIGNIYRAEVLRRVEIHPLRPANRLSVTEFERLWKDTGQQTSVASFISSDFLHSSCNSRSMISEIASIEHRFGEAASPFGTVSSCGLIRLRWTRSASSYCSWVPLERALSP